ncbi:MAG TPA: hypothetical protein PKW11_15305 [Pseudomonadota bacterium]|nr:hypothetical protein [Pseudomonadota bacterium]
MLELSPIGAWYYRLSCPGLGNGSKRYFPTGKGWRLRLFVPPAVPWAGFYDVVFYDEHGEIVAEASGVPVVASQIAPIGSGDHRRELRPEVRRERTTDGHSRRRKRRADDHTASAQTPPDPPNVKPSKCAFCNNVADATATASSTENATDDKSLRPQRSGAASDDPGKAPEVPHRSSSLAGDRLKWSPHRRAAFLRNVRRAANVEHAGQPPAPPAQRPDQDHEEADRAPTDRASRAPPKRPDG